ncbi:MAG: methionine synthase [Anaerolineae bacterium]
MRPDFEPRFLPLTLGSLPHTDAEAAWSSIFRFSPRLPAWPQLPKRTFKENMYVQYSEGFPGVVIDEENERLWVDRSQDLSAGLECLYAAYLENDLEFAAISPGYAAGLAALPHLCNDQQFLAIKGQVTGPVSWGLFVTDQDRRPVLYDDILADAIAKHLRLKAAWQERELKKVNGRTIIFIDEPYMSAFGSAYVSVGREQVLSLWQEVLSGVEGLKGMHCCGNTDWSILLATAVNILSFDAYRYAETLSLYADEVKAFLGRGGMIAWGIVPADDEAALAAETDDSLIQKLHEAMGLLVRKGVPFDDLLAACLISPSCGMRTLSVPASDRALELMASVSNKMRERYL